MARSQLTDVTVRSARPGDRAFKLSDGGGLYLLVQTNGSKFWRYNYRFQRRQKTLALGVYPDISLRAARQAHIQARQLLAEGVDPSRVRRQAREEALVNQESLFSALAREWWDNERGRWTENHADRTWQRLENDVLPHIGQRAITDLTPQDILRVIRRIESRNAFDVARRVLQDIKRIGRYAVQTGRTEINPASELQDIVRGVRAEHRASLPRAELPQFLNDLETYDTQGRLLTKLAIKLLILTFVRSGELRGARWREFDLESATWRIPPERMKMRAEHIVPLSSQAIAVLEQLQPITGAYELVFPSERRITEPMSDNTMRRAIFRLGYDGNTQGKSKALPHGFRATASSILNEQGFNPDAIERQLAHMERNGVRAAYTHHARYLDERAGMMQWWADFLDSQQELGTD